MNYGTYINVLVVRKANELYSYRTSLYASRWRQNSSCRVYCMPWDVSILTIVGSICLGNVLLVNEFACISLFSVKYVTFCTYIWECCLANVYYCSIDDHAGVLLIMISMLMNSFTWYLYRSNDVNFLLMWSSWEWLCVLECPSSSSHVLCYVKWWCINRFKACKRAGV